MRFIAFSLVAAMALAAADSALAQTRLQPAQPTVPAQTLQKKAPAPAKPDLVITQAQKTGPDTFRFYLKNQGAKNTWITAVKIENASSGGAGTQSVRGVQAGGGFWVDARIWPNVKAGDKFELYADFGNKEAESNEANNGFSFNW